jgi:ribonuclease HII
MTRAKARPSRRLPGLQWEQRAWASGKTVIAGVDEAGRGAWAGPLVAAAVVLPRDPVQRAKLTRALGRAETLANDSKLLTAEQRRRAAEVLCDLGVPHAVSSVTVDEIDALGLGPANRLALCRAVATVQPEPDYVLVDAFPLPDLRCTSVPIVHGDTLSVSIALASIVAKFHRDTLMQALDHTYREYGFAVHKGYGTAAHQEALRVHGVSPAHRRSFAPIQRMLAVGDG